MSNFDQAFKIKGWQVQDLSNHNSSPTTNRGLGVFVCRGIRNSWEVGYICLPLSYLSKRNPCAHVILFWLVISPQNPSTLLLPIFLPHGDDCAWIPSAQIHSNRLLDRQSSSILPILHHSPVWKLHRDQTILSVSVALHCKAFRSKARRSKSNVSKSHGDWADKKYWISRMQAFWRKMYHFSVAIRVD